jgi:4-amino-4-deoxy-L-arabinose transferase-like glycosyltransferase
MGKANTAPTPRPEASTARVFELAPAAWVGLLIFAQIVVWTLVPYICGRSLPLDVVSDGLAWGHEWQWGYYKHPPLPSWEVEAFFDALGDIGPYLLSQISVGLTYLCIFLLGRELMPARLAAAGTALTACVYFFSLPTPEFNHNVAQMPIWTAACFAYYKSVETRRLSWWLLLGALSGTALLTKYASGVLLAAIWLHFLSSPARRAMLATPGPALALAMCGAVAAPHLLWLVDNHFPTLSYATRRAGHTQGLGLRLIAPLRFLASQLLDISPAILVAAIAGFLGRQRPADFPRDKTLEFLAVLGIGPALIAAAISLLTGMGLRDMWGAPMWSLTGLLIVYAARPRWPLVRLRALAICVAAAFAVLPCCYVVANAVGPAFLGKPSRIQWPDRALAGVFANEFRSRTGQPLRIVAGDGWLAGLIAMRDPARPSVFTDGSMSEAPWITPQRLERQGALVVWQADRPIPAALRRLPNLKLIGTKTFAWPDEPRLPPLKIGWGIVAPGGRDAS